MEDKEKIERAAQILGKHLVGENLTYLLDAWLFDVEGVNWDRSMKASAIPNCHLLRTFDFQGHRFTIAAFNKHLDYDGEEYRSEFTLKVDDETVLATGLSTSIGGDWTVYEVNIRHSIRQAKLGPWMDHLAIICDRSRQAWADRQKRSEEEKARNLAADIDLGGYE